MKSLQIAATGMAAQQMRVEVISNNIANMSTAAYRPRTAEFSDLMYQQYLTPGTITSQVGTLVPSGIQLGTGVRPSTVSMEITQGALRETGSELDLAIDGTGYLEITLPSGESAYTRDGNLNRSADGEIVTSDGKHLPLVAKPARVRRVVKNKNEGRVLGVNHQGELASPLSTQLKHQAVHLAIRGAASVGGVFSMGAVPAAYGIIGAINPSFAFLKPVGKNVPHRRLKGFAMGVVSGLPGGFLIADTIIKGIME